MHCESYKARFVASKTIQFLLADIVLQTPGKSGIYTYFGICWLGGRYNPAAALIPFIIWFFERFFHHPRFLMDRWFAVFMFNGFPN